MSGLPMNLSKQEVLSATKKPPAESDYVWDGVDEDDRPLSKSEMYQAIKNKGGRPKSDNPKISATLRYDSNVLEYFKATGKGWQTRMNDVLSKYVASH